MKAFQLISISVIASILITSCKKDDVVAEKTTLQKVQAKWTVEKEVYRSLSNGVSTTWTLMGAPGDYVDFRADGRAYFKQGSTFDTTIYALVGNDRLVTYFPNSPFLDTFNIQVLNDNQLKLDATVYYNPPPDYFGGTIFLVK